VCDGCRVREKERKRELLFCCFKMKAFEINKLLELSETRNMQQAHD